MELNAMKKASVMATKMTIRDIGRLAGVSIATVSRVLNEKPDVDADTRARILRIMDEYRFVPSIAGAGLAGGRTGLLGVLAPSLTWAIMSPILSGVADVIEHTSHEMVLYSLSRKHERGEIIQRIVDAKLIDGLVAIFPDGAALPGDVRDGGRQVSAHLRKLREQGVPVVIIDDQAAHDEMPWISSNNQQGALQAVRYLISLGHRRIAYISGPEQYLCSRDRRAGYRAALAEAYLPLDPQLEVPEPPTAIFAANDDMAYGILSAAQQQALRVPEDLSVVGFDDAPPSAATHPPLTTVRQPFFAAGKKAAEMLSALIEEPSPRTSGRSKWSQPATARMTGGDGESPPAQLRVQLPVQLVERQSTTRASSPQEGR
jgi:LacI family transcriptional regulator